MAQSEQSSAETVIVICAAEAVDDLTAELNPLSEASVESSPIHHLDGQTAMDWVVLIEVGIKTLPAIVDSLTRFLTRNKVKSITVGKVKVENPRPEDIPILMEEARSTRR